MLRNAKDLHGFTIHATDGEIGAVDQFYFDDESWAIRYLTVETGGWLGGRSVLISPMSVVRTDWEANRIDVALTKKISTSQSPANTRPPIWAITGIPIIGTAPIYGAQLSTRQAGRFPTILP